MGKTARTASFNSRLREEATRAILDSERFNSLFQLTPP